MRVQCPRCQVVHTVDDRMAGTRAQCSCGAAIDIPRPAGPGPRPASTSPAPGASRPAAAPSIRCPRCQSVHAVSPAMYGTHARCGCGNMLWIPPPAGQPAMGMTGGGMAAGGMAAPGIGPTNQAAAGPAPFHSLVDELTHSDLGIPTNPHAAGPTAPAGHSGHGNSDALRKFLDKDKDTRVLSHRPVSIALQVILRMVGFAADFSLAALCLFFLITWSDEGGGASVGKAKYAVQACWCGLGLLLGGMGFHGLTSREPWGWHVLVFGNIMLISYQLSMAVLVWVAHIEGNWFGRAAVQLIFITFLHSMYLAWTVLDHFRLSVRQYYGFKESLLKAVLIVWPLAAFFGWILTGGLAFLVFFVL